MIRLRVASADRALVFVPGSVARSGMLQFIPRTVAMLLAFAIPATALAGTASIPVPAGLYAWSSYSNNPAADGSTALPSDLLTNPTFLSEAIAGVAIYVPLSTLLPDPLPAQYAGQTWSQLFDPAHPAFDSWNWGYLDATIATALTNKKLYSLAVVVGFQNAGSAELGPQLADKYLQDAFPNAPQPFKVPSFEQSLPSWFEPLCNPKDTASYYPLPLASGGSPSPGATTSPWTPDSCAPTIDVWYPTKICLSFKVPLPWNPNVQMFWTDLANAISGHLHNTCYSGGELGPCAGNQPSVYSDLTLVHLPGLSTFDEEISFVGPSRGLPPSAVSCPDGRTAQSTPSNGNDWATNAIAYDASAYALGHDLGYQEYPATSTHPATTNLLDGFETIAKAWIAAFPDRVIGLSALNDVAEVDLPDLAKTFGAGGEFRKIAYDLAAFISSSGDAASLLIQSDDLADSFWNPNGPAATLTLCSTPHCVDQSIPWVNPQHFFPGLHAVYGWQTDVGGVVQLPSGTWAPVAQCMLASNTGASPHCLDSTADSDIDSSFYGLLKYGWQPVTVKGVPIQYLEVMPGDVVLRPQSIQKAVLENGWFAPQLPTTTATPSTTPTAVRTATSIPTMTVPAPPSATLTPTGTKSSPTRTATFTHTLAATPTVTHSATPTGTATAHPSATPTRSLNVTPTAATTPGAGCAGDCNGDGQVTVDEILTMVNIALGNTAVTTCPAGDANHDGQITVDEILTAVNNALNGCSG